MLRLPVSLLIVCCMVSSAWSQPTAREVKLALSSKLSENQVLYVAYESRGKYFAMEPPSPASANAPGVDGQSSSTAAPEPRTYELEFKSDYLELWLDPANRRFRKKYSESQLALSGNKPDLLLCTDDLIFNKGEILRHGIQPDQGYEYQKGTNQSVVAAAFRDVVDLPIYSIVGLPNISGDLEFYLDSEKEVTIASAGRDRLRVSLKGPFQTKTELLLSERLAVLETRFYIGDRLNSECVVSEHDDVEGLRIPSSYSFALFGATEKDIIRAGIRKLKSARIEQGAAPDIFNLDIPIGSVVLDDADPTVLKQVDEHGSLIEFAPVESNRPWYSSIFVGIAILGGVFACLAVWFLRTR